MQSIIKRTQRDYSLAFKLAVVDQVEKGEFTYQQAQDKYGIQGRSTVLVWLRKHGRLDWSLCSPSSLYRGSAMAIPETSQTPEQRIKELEQQLVETKLKADFFEAVVDVMENRYGVKLSKKQLAGLSRTKRSEDLP